MTYKEGTCYENGYGVPVRKKECKNPNDYETCEYEYLKDQRDYHQAPIVQPMWSEVFFNKKFCGKSLPGNSGFIHVEYLKENESCQKFVYHDKP